MTPAELLKARNRLHLTQQQLGELLGYEASSARSQISHMEAGARTIRSAQRLLLTAYLDGYRPKTWPKEGADVA